MQLLAVPLLLTTGPAALSTFALVRALKDYRGGKLRSLPLWAVVAAWLVAAYAACVFLYYTVKPSPDLPPWKDPETLDLGLLFLLAPIGAVSTVVAGVRGASRWIVIPLAAAMVTLLLVGLLEGASV
jgi:hypothetical protein